MVNLLVLGCFGSLYALISNASGANKLSEDESISYIHHSSPLSSLLSSLLFSIISFPFSPFTFLKYCQPHDNGAKPDRRPYAVRT